MKLRRLSLREYFTLLIWFDGACGVSSVVNEQYLWAGCSIGLGLGLILIYLREKFC